MSNEESVPEPLSGTEIIDAIVFKVREQLRRDCFLSPNSAYEYFSGKIHIEVTAVDCGREAPIVTDIDLTKGSAPDVNDPNLYDVESDENLERQPPNVVRKETEQGVPVLTEDASGEKEIKRVKYQRQSEKPLPRGGTKAKHNQRKGRQAPPAA